MKTKNLSNKLNLKKETITHLNSQEMNAMKGGLAGLGYGTSLGAEPCTTREVVSQCIFCQPDPTQP